MTSALSFNDCFQKMVSGALNKTQFAAQLFHGQSSRSNLRWSVLCSLSMFKTLSNVMQKSSSQKQAAFSVSSAIFSLSQHFGCTTLVDSSEGKGFKEGRKWQSKGKLNSSCISCFREWPQTLLWQGHSLLFMTGPGKPQRKAF